MNYFFSSDFHLGHSNIIRYCNRPFKNADEMDSCIINNVNEMVDVDDVLYFLGDFSFKSKNADAVKKYRDRIFCKKIYFVIGNHDISATIRSVFKYYDDLKEVKVLEQEMTLCHYAMRVWNKSHFGTWGLFAHSHNSLKEIRADEYVGGLALDVGIDSAAYFHNKDEALPENYRPFTFQEIKQIMSWKKKKIDEHGYSLFPDHHKPVK